jgi:hypothetical protein
MAGTWRLHLPLPGDLFQAFAAAAAAAAVAWPTFRHCWRAASRPPGHSAADRRERLRLWPRRAPESGALSVGAVVALLGLLYVAWTAISLLADARPSDRRRHELPRAVPVRLRGFDHDQRRDAARRELGGHFADAANETALNGGRGRRRRVAASPCASLAGRGAFPGDAALQGRQTVGTRGQIGRCAAQSAALSAVLRCRVAKLLELTARLVAVQRDRPRYRRFCAAESPNCRHSRPDWPLCSAIVRMVEQGDVVMAELTGTAKRAAGGAGRTRRGPRESPSIDPGERRHPPARSIHGNNAVSATCGFRRVVFTAIAP